MADKELKEVLTNQCVKGIFINSNNKEYDEFIKSGADIELKQQYAESKKDAEASLNDKGGNGDSVPGLRKQEQDANLKLQNASKELEEAHKKGIEVLQKLANVRKRDALSAYGAFNQDSAVNAADKGNANLKLGKVFSTGVAAQNLTEAAKISATTSSLGQCVESGLKGLQGDKTEAMVKSIIDACGVAAEKMFKKNNS